MASTTTLTFAANNQARVPRSQGHIYMEQTYKRSVSCSDTQIFWFDALRIPHGALINKFVVTHGTSDGATTWKWGLAGGYTSAALFGSTTISGTQAVDVLVGGDAAAAVQSIKLSISDDQPLRWAVVTATQDGAVTSTTGSLSVTVRVWYSMGPKALTDAT